MHRTTASMTTLAVLALAGSAAAQTASFTGAIDGNWFNPANWDLGVVPGATNLVKIAGGFDVAALAADASGMSAMTDDLEIGVDSGGAANSLTSEVDIFTADECEIGSARFVPGLSSGRLTLSGASLVCVSTSTEDLDVGVASAPAIEAGSTSAHGVLEVTNGSITGFGEVMAGEVFQDGGDATGSITIVNGDLIGDPSDASRSIEIAEADPSISSTATGSISVENGSVRDFRDFQMASRGGLGVGIGSFTLVNAEAVFDRRPEFDSFDVAPGVQAPGSQALLELDRSFLSAGPANIGDEARIILTVDGTTRAADGVTGPGTYSAIDFLSADINQATIGVQVTYDAVPGDSFDLIRLDQGQVFTGSMFDVILQGGSELGFVYEIVPGTVTHGEIYRLTLVPGSDCAGDVDGDGDTDVFDFADLASNFGAGPGATRGQGDITGDGFVDVFDFADLASDFGCGAD